MSRLRCRVPGRRRATLALALLTCAAPAAIAPAAQASWSGPFDLMAPGTLDVAAPQLALSAQGATTAAFGLQDVDVPGSAQVQVAQRSAAGQVDPARPVPGAGEALGTAYSGATPDVLAGVAASGRTCCTAVEAVRIGAGATSGTPQVLVSGLDGHTIGHLVALAGGRTLAAVATGNGVWAAVSGQDGRFSTTRRLAGPARSPEALAAASLGGGGSLLAWTSVAGSTTVTDPRTVTVAQGAHGGVPRSPGTAFTVARGHRIEELAAGGRGSGATLAWIESWSDARGSHDQVAARDLVPHAQTRLLTGTGGVDSGLQLAGDPAGEQAIAWQACTANGACQIMLASHRAGRPFGAVHSVGAADPGQLPALSLGSDGRWLLAWTRGGSPWALTGAAGAVPGGPRRLSPTPYAYDITAASAPGRRGAVAWSQGTLNPSVVGDLSSG